FDFREYKEGSLVRRIRRRMAERHIDNFVEYARFLDRHPEEYSPLLNTILINVTGFFRDPDAWAALAASVIPRMIEGASPTTGIRVWSAGCSSGEEPFTAAI